jgi:hypothetical protein
VAVTAGSVSVVVCRGCCCGTEKHPDTDHDDQVDALRAAAGRLWTVDCLGPCERSNVIVVRGDAGRRWFGEVLDSADTAALAAWIGAGAVDPPPARVAARQFSPDDGPSLTVTRLALDADGITALVAEGVEAGTWTFGRVGASAEVSFAGTRVAQEGRTVTAVATDVAARFVVSRDAVAFAVGEPSAVGAVVLAVPRPSIPARGLVRHGPDVDAVRPADRHRDLVELVAGFAVRTDDPEVLAALRPLVGEGWRRVLEDVGELLVARSPTRVLTHALGRVEVSSVIGATTSGSRTDLRPGALELGQALPYGLRLPPDHTAVAMWFPPPGTVVAPGS